MNTLLNNTCNDNTLEKHFKTIIGNPPFSEKWNAKNLLNDERFDGKLAPKSKADFAFVQHMLYHLDYKGIMAVVLPRGVLLRGAAERLIRKYLIEERNVLDAVISLPANIFFGTQIATIILVFKKCREYNDNILFIDASNDFEKGKVRNYLSEEHIDKIVDTYKKRKAIEKYSSVVSLDEIRDNDYNLNIPRYVDTFEKEEVIDLEVVTNQLQLINDQLESKKETLNTFLIELGLREGGYRMEATKKIPNLRFAGFDEAWEEKKLGEVGESIIGLTYSSDDVNPEGTLVLRSSNIKDNKLSYIDNVYVKKDIPQKLITKEGDVLICTNNGSKNLIGKSALIDADGEGHSFGGFMTIFRSENGKFVFQLLQTELFRKEIYKNLGSIINRISIEDLNNMKFNFPNFPEQQKIANFLLTLDEIIDLEQQKLEKLQVYKKGLLQQIFVQ